MSAVPIRFEVLGKRRLPVIDLHLKLGAARLHAAAIVDTGSAFTILPEALLRAERFPVNSAKPFAKGIHGIGGLVEARYLEGAVLVLVDKDNRIQPVNLPRLFLVDAEIPVIFGREAMTTFNGRLELDFVDRTGVLHLG